MCTEYVTEVFTVEKHTVVYSEYLCINIGLYPQINLSLIYQPQSPFSVLKIARQSLSVYFNPII